MEVTNERFEDLVGAYVLDVCEPDEAAALEQYAASDPAAAAEIEELRAAAAWLGAVGALAPPAHLRNRLLGVAAERVGPATPADTCRAETERFDALLDTLAPSDLDVPTHNGLGVRDLVAHLRAIDAAFTGEIDAGYAHVDATNVEAITDAVLPAMQELSFAEVREQWRQSRELLIDRAEHAAAGEQLGGYPAGIALVVRAFETWTHHEDIEVALGRPVGAPRADVMRMMAEVAVGSLPFGLAARGYDHSGHTARLVLSGPGGGEWTIAMAAGEQAGAVPDVVLRASVSDFCRRAGDRIGPDDLAYSVEGDEALARDLVGAASAFAGL